METVTHEKGPQDYEALEAYIGTNFFCDAGRTAIAREIVSADAQDLAEQNPVRHWMYKVATRELARGVPDTPPLIEAVRTRLGLVNALDDYIARYETGISGTRLSSRQRDAFHDLATFMRGDPDGPPVKNLTKAGFIEMPTGSGKTVVFVELLKTFHSNDAQPIKSLVLVPSKEILHQTIGEAGKRGLAEFAPNLHVTSYYGDKKNLSGEVVVMTYASFHNVLAGGIIDKGFCDVVICDEAHHTLGPETKKDVQGFIKNKVAIALTATSEYAENKKVEHVFPERIHTSKLREVIEQGLLAPLQCWVYKTDVELDRKLSAPDFTNEELGSLAQLEGRNRKAVEFAQGFVEQGLQGLISCLPGEDLLHPRLMAEMLRNAEITDPKTGKRRAIRAQELLGTMSIDERNSYYDALEEGKLDVLTFVDTISEGWDNAQAKFLINLRPTCSPVFGLQRLGRILRPNGQVAQVVDFVDLSQKAQFVALHGLDEYRYVLGRVYGGQSDTVGLDERRINLPDELKDSIRRVNLVQVKKLIVGREYTPHYSDYITMQAMSDRLGLSPLALIYIARDAGIGLQVNGRDIFDVERVAMRDLAEDLLNKYARSKKYAFVRKLDEQLLRTFVGRQAEILAGEYFAPKNERDIVVRGEYQGMAPERIVDHLAARNVTFEELPTRSKQVLASAPLATATVAKILFEAGGRSNERLRSLIYKRLIREDYSPVDVLAYAEQTGLITDVSRSASKYGGFRIEFTTSKGAPVLARHKHQFPRVARYEACLIALGKAVGLEAITEELRQPTPHESAPPVFVPANKDIFSARQILNEYVKERKLAPAQYQVEHVLGQGKHAVFSARAFIRRKDGAIIETEGTGRSKQEASEAAALAMISTDEIVQWRIDNPPLTPAQERLIAFIKTQQPISLLSNWKQKNSGATVEFAFEAVDREHICYVSITDPAGNSHTFSGTARNKKAAKEEAATAALRSALFSDFIAHRQQVVKQKAQAAKFPKAK